jgi:sulfur carrier protein
MTVTINGAPRTLPEGTTVAALVAELGFGEKKVAVEVNRELVVKREWDAAVLKDGDRVELVTFVGGG